MRRWSRQAEAVPSEDSVVKASICMLSAAALICVAHTAARAQYGGGLSPYRPDLRFPSNFQRGPGGVPWGPFGQRGPVGPNIPGIGRGLYGSGSGPGSFSGPRWPARPNIPGYGSGIFGTVDGPGSYSPLPGTTPPEPSVRLILKRMEQANGAAPTPTAGGPPKVPPGMLEPLLNPPKPGFSKMNFPRYEPVKLPRPAPTEAVPSAAPTWPRWGWVVVGIVVLGLLVLLLGAYLERKRTAR
jgi:hypothetical protein